MLQNSVLAVADRCDEGERIFFILMICIYLMNSSYSTFKSDDQTSLVMELYSSAAACALQDGCRMLGLSSEAATELLKYLICAQKQSGLGLEQHMFPSSKLEQLWQWLADNPQASSTGLPALLCVGSLVTSMCNRLFCSAATRAPIGTLSIRLLPHASGALPHGGPSVTTAVVSYDAVPSASRYAQQ
jgi:hypothetical protein